MFSFTKRQPQSYDCEMLLRRSLKGSIGSPLSSSHRVRRCTCNIIAIVLLVSLAIALFFHDQTLESRANPLIAKFGPETWQKLDRPLGYAGKGDSTTVSKVHHVPGTTQSRRQDSALIMLCRNEDVSGVVQSMSELEAAFNSKFNYPWILFNDVPFTDEFIERTKRHTKAKIQYETIPSQHWDVPSSVDMGEYRRAVDQLVRENVKYAGSLSYRQMCRWNSGFFYKHPALDNFRYYWRVEPDVQFYSNISYDPFQYMADNELTYGFTIAVLDNPRTISTLWPTTLEFLSNAKDMIHTNNSWSWLISRTINSKIANGYSTCHFWSNFEIADLTFFRTKVYEEYFQHLDKSNGFFYERWGDAPVHSIAVGLFADKRKVHWFHDHGYKHHPYVNCPDEPGVTRCTHNTFAPGQPWLNDQDCRASWFENLGIT